MAAHAPYWPVVTLAIGVIIGIVGRGLWAAWEDR